MENSNSMYKTWISMYGRCLNLINQKLKRKHHHLPFGHKWRPSLLKFKFQYGDPMMDRHNPEASPVVHVRGLPAHAIEDDVISAVQHFGAVQ